MKKLLFVLSLFNTVQSIAQDNAKDEKEATEFMMNDPAVKNNIMLTKVYPYGIAVNKCN